MVKRQKGKESDPNRRQQETRYLLPIWIGSKIGKDQVLIQISMWRRQFYPRFFCLPFRTRFFLIFTILDCLFLFSFNLFGSVYFCLLFWIFRSLKKESILKMTAYPKYSNNFHLLTWTTTTYEREKSRYNIVISLRAINIWLKKSFW